MGRPQTVDMDAAWLRAELEKSGRSQSALARHLGVVPEIVNRIVHGRRQIKAMEADRIRDYLAATDPDQPATTLPRAPATVARLALKREPVSLLPVRGVVEAGSWREPVLSDLDYDLEEILAPRSVVDSGAFALRVAGPSMDLLYPDGAFIIVQPWHGGPLPFGKRVIVERVDLTGKVETTVKELVRGANDEPELWPRSSHPAHQSPIPYKGEDTTLRIIGVVSLIIGPG